MGNSCGSKPQVKEDSDPAPLNQRTFPQPTNGKTLQTPGPNSKGTDMAKSPSMDSATSMPSSISLPFQFLVRGPNGEVVEADSKENRGEPLYRIIKKIGEGGFAEIYLAELLKRREKVAIKFMERGRDVTHVRREIENHSNLSHPQVVQFKEVFLMPDKVGLVMEYIPGGDLFQYLAKHGCLDEGQARWVFQQLTVAVAFCHQHGVINRDLKPENTLVLERGRPQGRPLIKICDFGYSKKSDVASLVQSKVGTPGYIAPEVLQGKGAYGEAVDFWSLGCLLYVMLWRRYPFLDAEDVRAPSNQFTRTIQKVMRAEYEIPSHPPVSEECKNLIRGLLVVDPTQRLTLPGLLRDPWFTKDLPAKAFPQDGSGPGSQGSMAVRLIRTAYQTPEEIHAILTQAERRTMPPAAPII